MASTSRRYDHIYDPVYTASGARDHARATQKAARAVVERIPDRENMFSEIAFHKSHHFRTVKKSDLPEHVSTDFRTESWSHSEFPSADRHKFFKRPVQPLAATEPMNVMKEEQDSKRTKNRTYEANKPEGFGGSVTQGTQTLLRESEVQTDPYTPDFVVPGGTDPEDLEILQLAKLKHNRGLPITLKEVELIERARFKKTFLASLPPITDEASFNLRKRMMEGQELREFRYREEEIQRRQEEHLRLMKEALLEREIDIEQVSQKRLAAMKHQRMIEKDRQVLEIQKKRVKHLRKLARARAEVNPEKPSHRILAQYSDYSSRVYAPLLRDGAFDPTKGSHVSNENPALPDQLVKLQNLEQFIPERFTELEKPKISKEGTRSGSREHLQLIKRLEDAHDLIRTKRAVSENTVGDSTESNIEQRKSSKKNGQRSSVWRRRAAKLERPPTPRIEREVSQDDEALDAAITNLQRLIRGRAVQVKMLNGRAKRQELINELRTPVAVSPKVEGTSELLASKAAWDAVQGEVVSSTLDLLSKKLLHDEEEQKISNLVSEAIEKRRRREMIQAGTRQAELLQRQREDEVFTQVMRVHQGTADTFFDFILSESIENASEMVALARALEMKQKDDTELTDREVIEDIFASYVIPFVNRETKVISEQNSESKFTVAANNAIDQMMKAFS